MDRLEWSESQDPSNYCRCQSWQNNDAFCHTKIKIIWNLDVIISTLFKNGFIWIYSELRIFHWIECQLRGSNWTHSSQVIYCVRFPHYVLFFNMSYFLASATWSSQIKCCCCCTPPPLPRCSWPELVCLGLLGLPTDLKAGRILRPLTRFYIYSC